MLVDTGDGVVAQLLRAGVSPGSIEHVLITHLHWDHVLGYPAFVWGSSGVRGWVDAGVCGCGVRWRRPTCIDLVGEFYDDQAQWAIELGFDPGGWRNVEVADIEPGWAVEIDGCRIEAGAVVHPPMAAVAYRFTHGGRSVVLSGDTAACEELVDFARGVDLLVVDACASDPGPELPPRRQEIIRRLHDFHASPRQCIEMAARAGADAVVLNHHLPDVTIDVDTSGCDGVVHVGDDLERFDV